MLRLNNIRAQKGATQKKKRLGRGQGSGLGATAGKGDKGQLARSGGRTRAGFEGGQTPLYRRIPKRGFTNPGRRSQVVLNVGDLERLDVSKFKEITLDLLVGSHVVKGRFDRLTLLGDGSLTKSFQVKAHRISASAQEKIIKAGGSCELVPIPGARQKTDIKQKKIQKKVNEKIVKN
jgi:large subunit ribosomal protein L15